MDVRLRTEPTPGGVNEDFVAAGDGWAVVLDGATQRPGVDSGCAHGPAWLVRRLGGAVAARLAVGDGAELAGVLAEAITHVRTLHPGCDLDNPDSPSATASIVRWRGTELDWLVLADSPIVLDDGTITVHRDDRADRLPDHSVETVRRLRNQEGGFWVAAARPEAAFRALTGTAGNVRRAALLSDGASRLVEVFGVLTWAGLLDLLDEAGPAELVRRTRAAEDEDGVVIERGKPRDDATVAYLTASPA
ncbi:protein phosphatase 2C domain-containing protein [Actinomadura atramentaria]|uniref:protein phosphatase 2C domain-containing protein n=1 Tax=Actinomadura atramentaria TaxID=1990 RepID=UPI0003679830|nr:protein phosphatase 2C domain-containing protein [Actinomadura atramentaria]